MRVGESTHLTGLPIGSRILSHCGQILRVGSFAGSRHETVLSNDIQIGCDLVQLYPERLSCPEFYLDAPAEESRYDPSRPTTHNNWIFLQR